MGTENILREEMLERVACALEQLGYCILDDTLCVGMAAALARECSATDRDFHTAGVGRQNEHLLDARIRSDEILWLDTASDAGKPYLDFMGTLRVFLNRRLFLGLFDYDCHYARYASGAFYRKHVDAFSGNRSRVLSTVLYLNENWLAADGGELLLYAEEGEIVLESVAPLHNRLVLFLSERFPHEVKPATRARHSIAGWFRIKSERSLLQA
jgi:SM-20-related protein